MYSTNIILNENSNSDLAEINYEPFLFNSYNPAYFFEDNTLNSIYHAFASVYRFSEYWNSDGTTDSYNVSRTSSKIDNISEEDLYFFNNIFSDPDYVFNQEDLERYELVLNIFATNLRLYHNLSFDHSDYLKTTEYLKITHPYFLSILNKKPYKTPGFTFSLSAKVKYLSTSKIDQRVTHPEIDDSYSPYPMAIRQSFSNGYYIIERPPFKISVDFKPVNASRRGNKIKKLEIWIPWTLTAINLDNISSSKSYTYGIYVFMSDGSLDQNGERKYVHSMLPNTYDDSHICFSNSLNSVFSDNRSLTNKEIFFEAMNEYYSGGWNSDISPWYSYYSREVFSDCRFFTQEYLNSSSCSHITAAMKRSLAADYLEGTSGQSFKKFFYLSSSFNLSETLEFYSHIFSSKDNHVLTYDQIKERITSIAPYDYRDTSNLVSSIVNDPPSDLANQNYNITMQFFVTNFNQHEYPYNRYDFFPDLEQFNDFVLKNFIKLKEEADTKYLTNIFIQAFYDFDKRQFFLKDDNVYDLIPELSVLRGFTNAI